MSNEQNQTAGGNITNSPQTIVYGGTNPEASLTHWLTITCRVQNEPAREAYVQAILSCKKFDSVLLNKYHTVLHLCAYLLDVEPDGDHKSQLLVIVKNHLNTDLAILKLCWEITEIFQSAEPLEPGIVRGCYKSSAPNRYKDKLPSQQEQDTHQLFAMAVFILAELIEQSDVTHPLASFVQLVSRFVDAESQSEFETWLKKIEDDLGWNARNINRKQPQGKKRLLIRFEPMNEMNNRCAYSVTVWHTHAAVGATRFEGTQIDTSEIACQDVEAALSRFEGELKAYGKEVRLEFLLPVELLHIPFEGWERKYGKGKGPKRLSDDYEVVLRSYERWYDPDYNVQTIRDNHRTCWQQLPTVAPFFYLSATEVKQCRQALVAFLFHLPSDLDQRAAIFWELYDAGVPVILFPRATYSEPSGQWDALRHAIEQLAKDPNTSTELPTAIRACRDDMPAFQHIALIWDDPEWLPPDTIPLVAA